MKVCVLSGTVCLELESADATIPPPPSPPPSPPSPPPPPHDAADWGGYTPVPATATLPDARMCDDGDSLYSYSLTLASCRYYCDYYYSGCAGFSWGIYVASSPSPPSPPPPLVTGVDRRRTLLAHDEPAVDGVIGSCNLKSSTPTSSSTYTDYPTTAACYAKGARFPPTWRLVTPGDVGSGNTIQLVALRWLASPPAG